MNSADASLQSWSQALNGESQSSLRARTPQFINAPGDSQNAPLVSPPQRRSSIDGRDRAAAASAASTVGTVLWVIVQVVLAGLVVYAAVVGTIALIMISKHHDHKCQCESELASLNVGVPQQIVIINTTLTELRQFIINETSFLADRIDTFQAQQNASITAFLHGIFSASCGQTTNTTSSSGGDSGDSVALPPAGQLVAFDPYVWPFVRCASCTGSWASRQWPYNVNMGGSFMPHPARSDGVLVAQYSTYDGQRSCSYNAGLGRTECELITTGLIGGDYVLGGYHDLNSIYTAVLLPDNAAAQISGVRFGAQTRAGPRFSTGSGLFSLTSWDFYACAYANNGGQYTNSNSTYACARSSLGITWTAPTLVTTTGGQSLGLWANRLHAPAMVVDTGAASPYRGSVYIAAQATCDTAHPDCHSRSYVVVYYSRDGARTWSTSIVEHFVDEDIVVQPTIAISKGGIVHIAYTHFDYIVHVKSSDGAQSWPSQPRQVAYVAAFGDMYGRRNPHHMSYPGLGPEGMMNINVRMAAAPNHDYVHLVWTDCYLPFGQDEHFQCDIVHRRSIDAAATWEEEVTRIHEAAERPAFMPAIDVYDAMPSLVFVGYYTLNNYGYNWYTFDGGTYFWMSYTGSFSLDAGRTFHRDVRIGNSWTNNFQDIDFSRGQFRWASFAYSSEVHFFPDGSVGAMWTTSGNGWFCDPYFNYIREFTSTLNIAIECPNTNQGRTSIDFRKLTFTNNPLNVVHPPPTPMAAASLSASSVGVVVDDDDSNIDLAAEYGWLLAQQARPTSAEGIVLPEPSVMVPPPTE
jgi:hypothetical protein